MSDQTQPKLSLEEELDVLEAVYKVGKEKGLDLLRPEQVKKLRDAGRMRKGSIHSTKILNTSMIAVVIDSIVSRLVSECEILTRNTVSSQDAVLSEEVISSLVWDRFVFEYGTDPTSMKELLYKKILC